MRTAFGIFIGLLGILSIDFRAHANESATDIDLLPVLALKRRAYEESADLMRELKRFEDVVNSSKRFYDQHDPRFTAYAKKFNERVSTRLQNPALVRMLAQINFEMGSRSDPASIEKMSRAVRLYLDHLELLFREMSNEPEVIASSDLKKHVDDWLKELASTKFSEFDACLRKMNANSPEKRTEEIHVCLRKLPVVGQYNLWTGGYFNLEHYTKKKPGYSRPPHAMSPTGFISGNKLRIIHLNDTSPERFDFYERHIDGFEKHGYVENGVPKTVEFYKEKLAKNQPIFEEKAHAEVPGFLSVDNHPAFNEEGIFKEILHTIRAAKETLMIDIFFLGGTIGVVIAKEMIKAIERNPNLKIMLLRDNINHFGHRKEMLPVFNYLRAYSEHVNPKQLVVLPVDIDQHRTGLADWINFLIPENGSGLFGDEKLSLSPFAKSDHSKVLVKDGLRLDGSATALVGSKNWLDSSGGITWDKIHEVQGPAATIVGDNYVPDMIAALTHESQHEYLTKLYEANVGHDYPRLSDGSLDLKLMAKRVVSPWDILKRSDAQQTPQSLRSRKVGPSTVSVGENNHDSQIVSVRDQNMYLIENAKKTLVVADQFLYDPVIIDGLIRASHRGVQVDILLTKIPASADGLENFPNTLFLKQLFGKSKPGNVRLKFKKLLHTDKMMQEFHEKTLVADHKWTIVGSANKDLMTQRGSFRESQIMALDPASAMELERLFYLYFNDPTASEDVKLDELIDSGSLFVCLQSEGSPAPLPADKVYLLRKLYEVMYQTNSFTLAP